MAGQNYPDILDVSNLELKGSFEAQVEDVLSFVRLTREEVMNLRSLHSDLEFQLQNDWPGCKVHPFGSIITGLGIKTSDADCYVDIRGLAHPKRAVVVAKKRLMRSPKVFQQPFAITGAKVPIVQFLHRPTQTHCDVSFSSRAGVRNSELISFLLQIDRRALQLAILLKYWSKVHKLTGTNLMPNYTLIMLVIFYLQQLSILPPVQWLQHAAHDCDIVEGWNTSFNNSLRNLPVSENTTPLYDLLGGFFVFYRDFNYNDFVISPYMGTSILRSKFANLEDVPEAFTFYIDKVSGKAVPLKTDTIMCVQDPFQHNRNCAVAVHQKVMASMQNFIALGASIFEECKGHYEDFLTDLLIRKPQNVPVYHNYPIPNQIAQLRPGKVVKKAKNKGRKRAKITPWNQHLQKLQQRFKEQGPARFQQT